MARNARNLGAQASLPDVVLRDTLQILISVQNDHERKHVLENLKTYIEVVHFQGYSSESLSRKQLQTNVLYDVKLQIAFP